MEQATYTPTGPWDEFPETHWRAYIGKNADHYVAQLHRLQQGRTLTFNFAAFLLGFLWMAYRRMYLVALSAWILLMLEGTLEELLFTFFDTGEAARRSWNLVMTLVFGIAIGTFADRVYLWDARRMIRQEMAKGPFHLEDVLLERIARKGGTSWIPILVVLLCFVLLMFVADALAFGL